MDKGYEQEEKTQMINKHVLKGSTPRAIKEMQIQTVTTPQLLPAVNYERRFKQHSKLAKVFPLSQC